MTKDFWYELAGQPEAVAQIRRAVAERDEGVFHSWLITGPPGSGRCGTAVSRSGLRDLPLLHLG